MDFDLICLSSICFIKAGIAIHFVEIINCQRIIRALIFDDIVSFENTPYVFADLLFLLFPAYTLPPVFFLLSILHGFSLIVIDGIV